MGVPVILTQQSRDDLESIVRRIAEDRPERAREFGNVLIDKAPSPFALSRKRQNSSGTKWASVREIIHGSYRIIYEVFTDPPAVYVLRFWHAARGAPELGC